jgi:hypothetical protein
MNLPEGREPEEEEEEAPDNLTARFMWQDKHN